MRPTLTEKLVIPEKNNFSLFHQYNKLQRETILLNQYKMSTLQYIQSKKKLVGAGSLSSLTKNLLIN